MRWRRLSLLAAAVVLASFVGTAPHPSLHHHRHGLDYRHAELPHCPIAQASPRFQLCDKACDSVDDAPVSLAYPPTTTAGTPTVDAVQAALAQVWAGHSGTVDLWVRTGCHGMREAKYLFESVELFWPRGIGKVVVVLDAKDAAIASHLVPTRTQHNYDVHFEHVPCMPARIFNQVSYLMADYTSSADVIVTIDSDCLLHSPVTPSLLFRDGKIRIPHSRGFQPGMWDSMVEHYLGAGSFKFQFMVSQPVTFHRKSLKAYRDWHKSNGGRCYLDAVAASLDSVKPDVLNFFCWMCQLGSFINNTGTTAELYDFVDLDAPTDHPYQRMAIHTTYEKAPGLDYDASSKLMVKQGLCWSVGHQLAGCKDVALDYLHDHLFKYYDFQWVATNQSKQVAVERYLASLAE